MRYSYNRSVLGTPPCTLPAILITEETITISRMRRQGSFERGGIKWRAGWAASLLCSGRTFLPPLSKTHLPSGTMLISALFRKFKGILTNLKDDSSKFVQKSVGNNLNDLYKYDGKLAEEIIQGWREDELSASARWIIKHGQRKLQVG